MNEKEITCHDCHGFKWQNINIYPILIIFLCGLTPLLACWIVTTPKEVASSHISPSFLTCSNHFYPSM
jgi:hypothetical protein